MHFCVLQKMIRPKRLFLIYFCVLTFGLIWVVTNFGSWCPPSDLDSSRSHSPHGGADPGPVSRDSNLRQRELKLHEQEQHLLQWEKRLDYVKTELGRRFPNQIDGILHTMENTDIPTIYAITPTYQRPVQKAELTRLSQTFLHIRNFHWIIVEDSETRTELVSNLLAQSGLKYTHLNTATPEDYKMEESDPNWLKPKGVLQRNLALQWLRDNLHPNIDEGVIYFADDDNTYHLSIFEEMRYTHKVSVWPVGLVGKLRYESPICSKGRVTGFFTYWKPERPFPIDMASFAINLKLILNYTAAKFKLRTRRGYLESDLLTGLVTQDELEPRAGNCTQVLVWHTRTENSDLRNEALFKKRGLPGSDPNIEV